MTTWQVQVRPDSFQKVVADRCEVSPGGTLAFLNTGPFRFGEPSEDLVLAMAAGEWITVHDEDEGNKAKSREEGDRPEEEDREPTLTQTLVASLLKILEGER